MNGRVNRSKYQNMEYYSLDCGYLRKRTTCSLQRITTTIESKGSFPSLSLQYYNEFAFFCPRRMRRKERKFNSPSFLSRLNFRARGTETGHRRALVQRKGTHRGTSAERAIAGGGDIGAGTGTCAHPCAVGLAAARRRTLRGLEG